MALLRPFCTSDPPALNAKSLNVTRAPALAVGLRSLPRPQKGHAARLLFAEVPKCLCRDQDAYMQTYVYILYMHLYHICIHIYIDVYTFVWMFVRT